MAQLESNPPLIASRPAAAVALLLTGWVAVLGVRRLFVHPPAPSHWFMPFAFDAPHWVVIAVNTGFKAYLLLFGVMIIRSAQGKERVLVAGWFAGFVLGPIRYLVPSLSSLILYVDALAIIVAFISSVLIFLEIRKQGSSTT